MRWLMPLFMQLAVMAGDIAVFVAVGAVLYLGRVDPVSLLFAMGISAAALRAWWKAGHILNWKPSYIKKFFRALV